MKGSTGNRVLMLLENNPYRQDVRVRSEARTLMKAGYQVTIICPKQAGGKFFEVADDGALLYQFPEPTGGDGLLGYVWEFGYATAVMFFLSLIAWFRQGVDIIHAHNPPDTLFVIGAFYKLFGKRFMFDHHDLSPEVYHARSGGGNRRVYQTLVWLEKSTCRLANHVIATNESYKAIEMERGNVPEQQITIVRNGPDINHLKPVAPDSELRAKASIILGYVGIMGPQDGVDYLLRAVHHLVYTLKYTDVYCVILGKGSALASLKQLAQELKIEDYFWFAGWVSVENGDMSRYLSAVDICLDPDPSNIYNDRCTMIKMMEYMALGKPIVAFDLPEHRVTAQETAVYASNNDELEFAKKIAELIDDPAQRQRMGEFGLHRIRTALSWSFQEKQLLSAYEQIARSR